MYTSFVPNMNSLFTSLAATSVEEALKNSFLNSFQQQITFSSLMDYILPLIASMLMGIFICFIYGRFYKGVVYSRTFAITLVGMCVLTAMVTVAISSNIIISLGMVGALSIVRFRTAIKEPLDLLYLFWSITTGITLGAQVYALAICSAIIMVLVLLIMNRKSAISRVYIMIIHYVGDLTGDEVRRALSNAKYRVKSRTLRREDAELAIEVRVKGDNMAFVERVRTIEKVTDVTMVQYDGEYHT